jgi:hypothetical protein
MDPAAINQIRAADKDLPLRDDIRLLGGILGATVRDQEGEAVFGLHQAARQDQIVRAQCGSRVATQSWAQIEGRPSRRAADDESHRNLKRSLTSRRADLAP